MNILITEDDAVNQTLIKGILQPLGHSISLARTGKEALKLIAENAFDVFLFDVMMPDMDGLELTKTCRQDPRFKDTPILLITALSQKSDLLKGFEAGATDYITKPFNPTELLYRVKAQLQMRSLQIAMEKSLNEVNLQMLQVERQKQELEAREKALAEANKMLLEVSSRDSLTGLLNRRKGWDFMNYEHEKAKRSRKPCGVIMMDLDKFKSVNDSLGHEAGDAVLKAASQCLSECMRTSDILVRWGGEEFVAALPETDEAGLAIAAEKIRSTVESFPWALADGRRVTVSLGTTIKQPDSDWEHSLQIADKALYTAKEQGRNRVVFEA